jgi:predicted MFS family arabinose efflux permease
MKLPKLRLRFQILFLAGARFIMHTGYRMLYPFLGVFARGLGVDLATISVALTAHDAAGAVGPFLASITDTRGRKTGILLGVGIFAAATSLIAVWPTYPGFFAGLVLISIGVAVTVPSIHAYLGDRVPYAQRGRAIGLTELAWSVSFIVGVPLVGLAISRWGWSAPFWPLAALGLLAFILLAVLLPPTQPDALGKNGTLTNFHSVLTYGPALAGLTMSLFFSASNEVVNMVFGTWMEDRFGLQIAALGAASLCIGVAEFSAESLVTAAVDHLGKERCIAVGLILNCAAAVLFPLIGGSLAGAFAALFFFFLTFEFLIVSSLPLMTEIRPAVRGTLMAANVACFSIGRALGALGGAPLYQQWGITGSAVVAVVLNLLSLAALHWVKVEPARAD